MAFDPTLAVHPIAKLCFGPGKGLPPCDGQPGDSVHEHKGFLGRLPKGSPKLAQRVSQAIAAHETRIDFSGSPKNQEETGGDGGENSRHFEQAGDEKIQGGTGWGNIFLGIGIVLRAFWNEMTALATLSRGRGRRTGVSEVPGLLKRPHGPLTR